MASLKTSILCGLGIAVGLAAAAPIACIASSPTGKTLPRGDEGGGGGFIGPGAGGGSTTTFDPNNNDPHATVGAEPSHGPFSGGQRVLVRGKGFGADVRVWIGDVEVDGETRIAIDETRVQVTAPPGVAGPADVTTQNGNDDSTRRTLAGGYAYDAIYAVPDEGPVSGGTKIQVVGQETHFDGTTTVRVDNKPCEEVVVQSETVLSCTVPAGTPGAKTLSVTTGEESLVVLDGFTYEDSDNGFKGGLDGAPLNGQMKVLIYDNFSGDAVPGGVAIVGTDPATALFGIAGDTGAVVIEDPSLVGPHTVTVTAYCHSPITFIDVPVDTVTVYLDPVLSPACASQGDPPPVGGKSALAGYVRGELVWEGGVEFKKAPWTTVPLEKNPNEQRAAYVFFSTTDPTAMFSLPQESLRVTPDTDGQLGYKYGVGIPAGNRALYALAGIEDRSVYPPKFTAYAMGIVKGVPVVPDEVTDFVYIPMTKTLDQALTLNIDGPSSGPKGPDRLRTTLSVNLGNDGFAILPIGHKTQLLPFEGPLTYVGAPSLDAELYGSTYYITARAATGQAASAPMSVRSRILAVSTAEPIPVDGFVGVPTLLSPALNDDWDGTHLSATFGAGNPVEMSVYDILAGNGLVHWVVVVPQGDHDIELPDLSPLIEQNAALPKGPVVIGLYGATYEDLEYGKVRYRHLRPTGMLAYGFDTFAAHLE